MPGRFLRVLDAVTLVANVAGSCLIVGLVILITADVIGREALGAPVSGVPELVSLSIVAIVFLQAPQALRAGRLTRSDGVLDAIKSRKPRLADALETVFDLVGIAVLGAILYAHWPIMTRAWERNDFVGAVGDFTAPTWPVKAMLAVGAALLALQFVARILRRYLS
ncbi:TRAP transporter small permease subunit [Actibacterium mucosum]|nr:TRAP transporter small permease subunit [Actibacterium mucosum]